MLLSSSEEPGLFLQPGQTEPRTWWEKLLWGQPSLQHSIDLGFIAVARQMPLLSERHMKACLELAKKTPKGLWLWETRFSGLMKPRLNCLASILSVMSGGNQAPLITCLIPSQRWKWLSTYGPHPTWQSFRGSAQKNGRKSPNPGVQSLGGGVGHFITWFAQSFQMTRLFYLLHQSCAYKVLIWLWICAKWIYTSVYKAYPVLRCNLQQLQEAPQY